MAPAQDQNPTREAQESLFYERCWRCRAVVPNSLVRRRKMKIGHSTGTHLGTGATYTRLDHYEMVSLCGVCDDELTNAEQKRNDASYRRWSWFWRIVGVAFWTAFLTRVGIPFPASLAIMLTLAYFHILGRAIITIFVTTIVAGILGYPPSHYAEPIMLSWAIIWPGLILWQLWYPENRPWPFRKMRNAQPSPSVNQEASTPTAVLSHGGDTK